VSLPRRTLVAAMVGPGLGLGAIVPAVIWWDRLPDPMATHWGISGHPDGSMARGAAVALVLGVATVAGLSSSALALVGTHAGGLVAGIGAMFSWLAWCTILANKGARTWHEASYVPVVVALPGIVVGLGAATIVWRAVPHRWPAPGERRLPSEGLRADERAVWAGHAGWSPLLPFAVAILALLLLSVVRAWSAVIPLLVIALGLTAFCSVKVTADRRGLRIRYGWLPWPTTTISLSEIRRADAIDLRPMEWGGWGYRGSRRAMGRAALVLRRGSAIKLDLADGSTFAVTVDDAATGAGVLNDLRTRI
jgi:hypothetical protein